MGGVLYVKTNGSDNSDGLTWNTAFKTIEQAIKSAYAGDEIRVAAGTYTENLTIAKSLSLYGGYPANGGDNRNY